MIRVLYDNQIFTLQRYGGISRLFFELMNSFKGSEEISYNIPSSFFPNDYLEKKVLMKFISFLDDKDFKGKGRFLSLLKKINFQKNVKALKRQNFDVFHPTYYDPYFLEYLNNKPFVLTVYDMIHEIYPEMFPKDDQTAKNKKILAEKATKIIAISQNTKKDIIKFYGIKKDKISVIYLGSSLKMGDEEYNLKNIRLPKKYILFVGDRHLYKNFVIFVKSIAPLLREGEGLSLVCAGGKKFTVEEVNIFDKLQIQNKIIHLDINNDKTLSYLYSKAIVFVFPSLYEGFGIPILEAFSCRCPVAASNKSSLPEVGGDAALYFDPSDENSIRETVKRIVYNNNLRENLKLKGTKQLKKFSWRKTAQETLNVYKEVIKEVNNGLS